MINLSILFFMLFFLFLNRIVYKNKVSLPSAITIIWCITLFLSRLGLYDIYKPSNEVILYAMLFISTFDIFSIFFYLFLKRKESNIQYKINYQFLSFISTMCIILMIFFCFDSVKLLITTRDFSIVRNSFISYKSISNFSQVLLTITIIPLGKACYIILAIDYIKNKKFTFALVISLMFSIVCILLTGGRSFIFFLLLTFLIALYKNEKNLKNILKNNKKIVKLCIVLVVLLIIVTMQRNLSNGGIYTSLYTYFCGCFNLFGVYLNKGMVFKDELLLGKELISGFSFPIIQILRYVFGMNILPGNYILSIEATSKYIAISPTIAINATPTTMYYAIRDFGILGLIIYPIVLSYFYVKLLKKANVNNNIYNESIYTYFVCLCLLLNMSYQFETFQNVGVFMYIYILCNFFKKSKNNDF